MNDYQYAPGSTVELVIINILLTSTDFYRTSEMTCLPHSKDFNN